MPIPSSAICSRGVCGMMASLVPLCWMHAALGHSAATLPSNGSSRHLLALGIRGVKDISYIFRMINDKNFAAGGAYLFDRMILHCRWFLARCFRFDTKKLTFIAAKTIQRDVTKTHLHRPKMICTEGLELLLHCDLDLSLKHRLFKFHQRRPTPYSILLAF